MPINMRADFAGWVDVRMSKPTSEGRTEFVLTAGQIDDEAEAYFGRGSCHWLAGAIHSVTGWPLATIEYRKPDGTWQSTHTAAQTPDGTLLDIFGDHPAEDVRRRYIRPGCEDIRVRVLDSRDMPGEVLTGIDHLRGDPLWWCAVYHNEQWQGLLLHFARLLVRRNGFGDRIHDTAREQPHPRSDQHETLRATPSTTTPASGGIEAAAMSTIDDVRAALSSSNSKAEAVLGLLAQAIQDVQEITGIVQLATEGSNRPEVAQVQGMYAQVAQSIEQATGMVAAARTTVEGYAASL